MKDPQPSLRASSRLRIALNRSIGKTIGNYTGDEFGVAPKRVVGAKKSTPLSKGQSEALMVKRERCLRLHKLGQPVQLGPPSPHTAAA